MHPTVFDGPLYRQRCWILAMKCWIELHCPGCVAARYEILNTHVTMGTGSEATLRVPTATGFQPVHLELTWRTDSMFVKVADSVPAGLFFEGAEHRSITVSLGAEVFVGNARVTVVADAKRKESIGTPILLTTAFVLGLAGIGIYKFHDFGGFSESALDTPPLTEDRALTCGNLEPAVADRQAREKELAASAKQERYPFDPSDGVQALRLLRESQVCYQAAGKSEDASRMLADAEHWSRQLNIEYSSLRLRLTLALEQERLADAIDDIRQLQALLAHRSDSPYQQWLAKTRNSLLLRLANSRH